MKIEKYNKTHVSNKKIYQTLNVDNQNFNRRKQSKHLWEILPEKNKIEKSK